LRINVLESTEGDAPEMKHHRGGEEGQKPRGKKNKAAHGRLLASGTNSYKGEVVIEGTSGRYPSGVNRRAGALQRTGAGFKREKGKLAA